MASERTMQIFQAWLDLGRPEEFDFPGRPAQEITDQLIQIVRVRAHRMRSGDGRRDGVAFAIGDRPVEPAETVWDVRLGRAPQTALRGLWVS